MVEYAHGSACHYCGELVTMRVSLEDVYADSGDYLDVSIDVDMEPWWVHIAAHREAGHAVTASGGQALPQGT